MNDRIRQDSLASMPPSVMSRRSLFTHAIKDTHKPLSHTFIRIDRPKVTRATARSNASVPPLRRWA